LAMSIEMETVPITTSLAEVEAKVTPGVESLVEAAPASASKMRTKGALALVFVSALLCAVIMAAFALWPQPNAQENPEDTAFFTLQQLTQDGDNGDANRESFNTAFNTFDTNNDDVLNETEFFAFFVRELSFSAEFSRMDVDGDDVLSYPETVAYVQRMGEIEAVKNYYVESLSGVIMAAFNFTLAVDDEESLALFLEYFAFVVYFGTYDIDMNGYIHHDEFTAISAHNEFVAYAKEDHGGFDREDFFNMLYGDDEFSWQGVTQNAYGELSAETLGSLAAIEITSDMVLEVNISLNPMQFLRDARRRFLEVAHSAQHRRLQPSTPYWLTDVTNWCMYGSPRSYFNGDIPTVEEGLYWMTRGYLRNGEFSLLVAFNNGYDCTDPGEAIYMSR